MPYVYLIHFEKPYYHAQHYIGYTKCLRDRMNSHKKGQGSRLIAAIMIAGIEWSKVWHKKGTRIDERAMKNCKKARMFCPVCRNGKKYLGKHSNQI